MKKILKLLISSFVLIITFILILSLVVNFNVQKHSLERRLGNILSHQVKIAKIESDIFSVIKGISLYNIKIIINNKLKNKGQNENNSLLIKEAVLIPAFFKMIFNNFIIEKIILNNVKINLECKKNWNSPFLEKIYYNNFYNKEGQKNNTNNKSKFVAISIDEFNLPLNIKNIVIQDSSFKLINNVLKKEIYLEEINGQIYDLSIDPDDLFSKNQIKIKFKSNIKLLSENRIQAFLYSEIKGKIIPFDNYSKVFYPELQLDIKSRHGFFEEAPFLKQLKSVPEIKDYCDSLEFLNSKLFWNNFFIKAWLNKSGGNFKEGIISNDKYTIYYAGKYKYPEDKIDLAVNLLLNSENSVKLAKTMNKNIYDKVKYRVNNSNEINEISTLLIKKIKNKSNNIKLKYLIKGKAFTPKVVLAIPGIKSFNDELNNIINNRLSHDR